MTQHGPDTESGSTTEQVKEQVREQAQVAQDKVAAPPARPGAGSATRSTSARPRPASG